MNDQPIELEPLYSTNDVQGKCIKCLAEQKLDFYLRELLNSGQADSELMQRYEALLDFLTSPESQKLRDESERYLAEGKRVSVNICYVEGRPEYRLKIKN